MIGASAETPPPGAWGALVRAARLNRRERRRLCAVLVLSLGAILAATALLSTSGFLISRAAQRPDILALTAVITAVRALSLLRAVLRYGERLVSHDLALRVLARTRVHFYSTLAPLGSRALGTRRRGELLSRFVADVDALQDLYLRALAPPVVAVLTILAVSAGIYLMLATAGAVLLLCLLGTATAVPLLTAAIANAAGRRQAGARADLTQELTESLGAAAELAIAGRGRDRVGRIDTLSARLIRLGRRDALAAAAATTLGGMLSGLTLTLMLIIAIPAVDHHTLSPVLLAAIVLAALGALEAIAPLPLAARSIRASAQAADRLADIEALVPTVADPPCPRPLEVRPASVRLRDVSFRYGPEEPWLLRDVQLELGAGCRVAVSGPSGAGKSTLAQLLVRFSDPTHGCVEVGGVDARALSLDTVRGMTVLIAQDAHVFQTTVRENLRLANRDADDQRLRDALAAVGLGDWLAKLPGGLDAVLGENGEGISGGQRQRLTVARALVSRAPFIVLDEPTAQLDAAAAETMLRGVSAAAGHRGLVVITHRAEARDVFDRQLTLNGGGLVAAAGQ